MVAVVLALYTADRISTPSTNDWGLEKKGEDNSIRRRRLNSTEDRLD